MTIRAFHALTLGLSFLAACVNPAPAVVGQTAPGALAIDLGPSTRVPVSRTPASVTRMTHQAIASGGAHREPAGDIQLVHDGRSDAHAVGVVNAVDPSRRSINLTHDPIPSIGWPSMTMDFPVAPSVDLSAVKPGAKVNFTIEKGKGGMYEIQSVRQAGAR